MDKWIYDKLCSNLSHLEGLTALDLGCGEGANAVGLAKLNIKTTAIDKQAIMIEKTKKLASKEQIKITTVVSSIQDFQPNTQYDIVLFTHVLHFIHSKNQPDIIQKTIDLVKPGGILVFADLEDVSPVSPNCLSIIKTALNNIKTERFKVKDVPHLGANYPHNHKVFYLIGTKNEK